MLDIEKLIRKNILNLKPYSTARDEFKGDATIFLDANENPFGSPLEKDYNRYPDPLQIQLKKRIAQIKGIPEQHIFLGNGSDEPIDLLIRIFCEPAIDNIIICPPTYGMYAVAAQINDVAIKRSLLDDDFNLNIEDILGIVDKNSKLLFICSPNNPSGNTMDFNAIEFLLNNFQGIVIVDEAYINYSSKQSVTKLLTEYENLVVLQTFSKAWGLAGLRLGMAFSNSNLISLMNKVKSPYNINDATAELVLEALNHIEDVNKQIVEVVKQRNSMMVQLKQLGIVDSVFESDANFILVKFKNAALVYNKLLQNGIVVRDRSNIEKCDNCLRITIGTSKENTKLMDELKQIV